MFESSRRGFMKTTGTICAAIFGAKLVSPDVALAQAPKAAAPAPAMVNETEPLAKSLGYHADAKKVDVKKWPKRAGAAGGKQYCYNCQFYVTKEDPTKVATAP
ncbi:MAG: high-potential iron-sulfur protein [Bdellovibrionota bacterium]